MGNSCANMRAMEIMNEGMMERFGEPGPTPVEIGSRKGNCILVSGNNLLDLEAVLEQTRDRNVNVYTHDEMIAAHGYPRLQKFPHLVGNYGGAWQNQQKDFEEFPGAILVTSDHIQKPRDSYRDRLFTTGLVGWPGVTHLERAQFKGLIDAARIPPGFKEDRKVREIMVGYGHRALVSQIDKMVQGVEENSIRHVFLIGGCDASKTVRNYFTDFAQRIPKDSLIFTMGSGKYRFNNIHFGRIGEFSRLMDFGQSGDIYSAVKVIQALAEGLRCKVNDLPISIIYSWYDQKTVSSILTLFNLGIKNKVRIGPSRPAWITQNVWGVLSEKFNLRTISVVDDDLKSILGEKVMTARAG